MTAFIRPASDDLLSGVSGVVAGPAPFADSSRSARAALEEIVAEAVADGPACVAFSGGRDSSAVLAVATAVARKRGLPLPHPITLRYPGDADADESCWQELVIRHLRLTDWTIIQREVRSTYLGEDVRANLRRRGLVWPAALQLALPELEMASGGTLLTGEGGDEILGTRRITPLALLLHFRRTPSRPLVRWLGESLTPRPLTAASVRRDLTGSLLGSFLTAQGRRRWVRRRVAEDRRPLHWGAETLAMVRRRVPAVLAHNYQVIADEHKVTLRHPLLDERFLRALAAEGGRWGFAGRTDLMRHLFADLLPDELLRRSTKAHFGGVRWGTAERDFASSWDGGGLDDSLDPEALRAHWLSERPQGATVLALHAAWLHSEGLTWEGAAS